MNRMTATPGVSGHALDSIRMSGGGPGRKDCREQAEDDISDMLLMKIVIRKTLCRTNRCEMMSPSPSLW